MWAKDRHHLILAMLAAREQVSMENLAEEFGVSRETLRRDIVQLEAEGHLKRVHGGFMRVDCTEPPFQRRMETNAEAKQRIGAAAARLVEPGMMIAVDAGSTTIAFAEYLANIPKLTVITNSLGVATTVSQANHANVILLGGSLGTDVPGTFGEIALAQLRRFHPEMSFISPSAMNATSGAMNFDQAEADIATTMSECTSRLVVLADTSKLGTKSRVQICSCESIHTLITDRKAKRSETDPLREAGVQNLICA